MALKFNFNQPVELALTRPDPKVYQTTGRPASFMYSVVLPDGTEDKAFLSASCSQTIVELRIQPREFFSICRRKTPQGIEFYDVHTSAKSVRAQLPAPPAQPQAASDPPAPRPVQRASSSNSASSVMGAALIAAIDATKAAERYAKEQGLEFEFGPDDVRAIANTLYIQACKDPLFQERVA